MQRTELVFDGDRIGSTGVGFGSFQITEGKKRPRPPIRLRLGYVTNNEAEYLTSLSGVRTFFEELNARKIPPKHIRLEIRGDSQLVINQCTLETKEPSHARLLGSSSEDYRTFW